MSELSSQNPYRRDERITEGFEKAVEAARQEALERILMGSLIVAAVGSAIHLSAGDLPGFAGYGLAAGLFFLLTRQEYWTFGRRTALYLVIIYLGGVLCLFRGGVASSGALYLAAVPPLAILWFGSDFGLRAIIASALTWLGVTIFFKVSGYTVIAPDSSNVLNWTYVGVDLMLLIVVFTQVLRQFRETQDYVVTVTQQKRNLQEARAELIQLTQELDYERYLLHTLLDTVSDRIIFKDLGGRYTRVSKAVAEQFGVPLRQVRGQTDFDFFAPDYARAIKAEERQLLQSGEAILDKVERENWRDGRPETWAIKSRILLKGEDDKVVGWLGTARDITEVKKAQEADRRHAQQLSATAEVGRAVTSSLDLQTLLRVLVELVQETFGYYGVNVWLLSEPPDLVQLRAGFSPQGEDLGQMEIQISMKKDKNITAVCRSGEYRLAAQVDEDEQGPDIDRFPKARAQLLLPLQIAEKKLGALEILSDQPNAFQADDVILLQSLADQLTIAIRNASLYEIERQRRHLAETLYQVGRALSRTLNLEEVLDLILEQLDEIVPADRLAVMLVEADELEFMATRGFPAEVDVSQLRMMIRDDSIFGAILRTQEPLPIPDVKGNPDWQAVPGLPQARSWMGVPLIRSDKVVGMLSLTRERLDPYSVSEVTLARTFAGQAVLALENARLYDNLARFSQQLEEMVQERTEELQLAYEQLERLDRTKSDFIKVTSHELRTPLTVLQGYSQMLISDSTIASNEMLGQLAQGIQTGAERMHDIVNGMLDIAKIDSRSLDLSTEPVSLSYLLKSVNKAYDTDLIQRQLQMYMDGLDVLPPIEADSRALYKVFFHLVGNAIKYTPDGGQIVVLGRVLEPETDEYPKGWVEIVVSDTGIGIDPEFQELIFIKFFQTGEMALHSSGRTKFKGGGPGLGLPIARGIIQAHQGRLWVESPGHDEETCPGSHFHVVLPVRQKS